MKLHLCCGDVYLAGYVNVDQAGCIVDENVVDYYPTDLAHYYQNRIIGSPQTIFIDEQIDLTRFPWHWQDGSIDEIVMIQAIEHFTLETARQIISEIKRILVSGGKLLIDFPDIEMTVRQLVHSDPVRCMRYVYGSERNPHLNGFTRESFVRLLGQGWDEIEFREIVRHDYPAIGCEAIKL